MKFARRAMFSTLAICTILVTAGFSFLVPPSSPRSLESQPLDRYFQSEMEAGSISGAEYIIVQDGEVLAKNTFGMVDQKGTPLTSQTVTNIGGISKSMTTLAVYQLNQAGKIDLDASVTKYLPWFSVQEKDALPQMTIRTLLDQTSGLSKSAGQQPEMFREGTSLEQIVRGLSWARLVNLPGKVREESNLNYLILGEIIQTITGQTYADYVEQNILTPLEMKHTYLTAAEARKNGLIPGSHFVYGFKVTSQEPLPDSLAPIGYVYSTLDDMSHYLSALTHQGVYQGAEILSGEEATDLFWNPLSSHPVGSYQLQSGESRTYDSALLYDPGKQMAVLVLDNTSTSLVLPVISASTLARGLYSLTQGVPPMAGSPLKNWYWAMDICAVLAIIAGIVHGLGMITWRKRYAEYPGNHFWAFLPTILVDYLLPLVIIFGVPFAIIEKVPLSVNYAASLWSRLFFSIPDIAYIAYIISAIFFIMGFVKGVWIMKSQQDLAG